MVAQVHLILSIIDVKYSCPEGEEEEDLIEMHRSVDGHGVERLWFCVELNACEAM